VLDVNRGTIVTQMYKAGARGGPRIWEPQSLSRSAQEDARNAGRRGPGVCVCVCVCARARECVFLYLGPVVCMVRRERGARDARDARARRESRSRTAPTHRDTELESEMRGRRRLRHSQTPGHTLTRPGTATEIQTEMITNRASDHEPRPGTVT
jgi:hypothetical protein